MADADTLQELEQTAILAELARPLVHECNNFLNTLLLQIALLEAESSDERKNLAHIRRDGRALAGLMQEWQRYRKPTKKAERADLNVQLQQAVDGVRGEWDRPQFPVTVKLSAQPLQLPGSAVELKSLCFLLLRQVLSHRGETEQALEVSTELRGGASILTVQEKSASAPWVTAFEEDKSHPARLVPSACRALAQRLQARLAVQQDASTAMLTVTWRAADVP